MPRATNLQLDLAGWGFVLAEEYPSLDSASVLGLIADRYLLTHSLGQLTWTIDQDTNVESAANLALSVEEVKAILMGANLLAQQWQTADLGDYSPILSPLLKQEKIYDAIELPISKTYLQGQHSLWDVAAKIQTSIVLIGRSLINLEKQNIIELQEIPDFPESTNGKLSPQPDRRESENYSAMIAPQPINTPAAVKQNQSRSTNQARNTPQATFDPNKPLIACIDDSPVLGHSIKKILASVGYQSMVISDPMAGMSLLAKYRPNLILLDLLMPTVSGYSVCKFLRETTLFKTTPIVILTAKDTIVDRTRARLAGATDFVTKPPEPRELLQVIRVHLTDIPWS